MTTRQHDKPYISFMETLNIKYELVLSGLGKIFLMNSNTAAVYWVDRLDTIYKPYSLLSEKHVNPDEVDYNPFWDKKKAGWDEKHRIRFNTPFDDSCLNIDFLNATSAEGEPLIGSARLPLRDLVLGQPAVKKKLVLTGPSGSPIGEVTVMVAVRRVENPLPPEKTVTVVYEEQTVDDIDENDLT
ncbi:hypothetical protein RHSIM_RhsimUnG0027900 [Rhododendron simsii]|uniref:Uncharacterized protein n=1 Tax=Rhododendron simsii TaxID=118357 RepID=A0A834FXP8_RHOSS|nr:hypothetical protein RHSIM_RhsimUnG0027900 [Rhododendron simsii]